MNEEKLFYQGVLKLYDKYQIKDNYNIRSIQEICKQQLWLIELDEKYDIKIQHTGTIDTEAHTINDHMCLFMMGEKYKRLIGCPDDNRQPDNELLLNISFSTGPYIFGEHYPKEFFNKFFEELKSYNPKYIDTKNSSLYYSMDNAGVIFKKFLEILDKYYNLNKEDTKKRQIAGLKQKIEKLSNELEKARLEE